MKFNTIYDKGMSFRLNRRYVMFVKNEDTKDIDGYFLNEILDKHGIVYVSSKFVAKKMTKREFNSIFKELTRLIKFEELEPEFIGLEEVDRFKINAWNEYFRGRQYGL